MSVLRRSLRLSGVLKRNRNPIHVACFTRLTSSKLSTISQVQYDGPEVISKTFPGAKDTQLREEMNKVCKTNEIQFFVDYKQSSGNYIVDSDGNRYLDVYQQVASCPLGHNHPAMREIFTKEENLHLLCNRPALGNMPPIEFPSQLQNVLLSVAPYGKSDEYEVQTMMCGSCGNENAMKHAMMYYMSKYRRNDSGPTEHDLNTCMYHQPPGTPDDLCAISFEGGFHGRTFMALSLTHSKGIHKVDIPAMKDTVLRCPFPQLKYPLADNMEFNAQEEDRCLNGIRQIIRIAQEEKKDVACSIIEPVQAEGGDRHASDNFFRELRRICSENNIVFIVDEVQTGGGATGEFWAHEHWKLEENGLEPADIVVFAKKMQIAGYYYRKNLKVKEGFRIFNTWMGDPVRLLQAEAFLKTAKKDNLMANVNETGNYLAKELTAFASGAYKDIISNVRGRGTFLAFDCDTPADRDKLVRLLREEGVHAGGCGSQSIRLRPALIFEMKHAEILIKALGNALKRFQ